MTYGSTPEQSELASRITEILDAKSEPHRVRVVRMFGGLSFMVNDAMAVVASRDGDLLVRVDPGRYDELLQSGAEPAFMGPSRPMGQGWLNVLASRLRDDAELTRWIDAGIEARHSRSQSPR